MTTTTEATAQVVRSATIAQIVAGRWSTMPASPLDARLDPSVVWAGTELVVWGGDATPSGKAERNGAAYDPTTRRWQMLAPSPFTPREGAVAVWTGSEVVFWGGVYPEPAGRVTPGSVAAVAYRPTTNTWRTIGAAPLPPTSEPIGVWTGDRVVLFSGAHAASYNPETNVWQQLPTPSTPHRPLDWTYAAAAGPGRVVAWSVWYPPETSNTSGPQSFVQIGGADLFRYDESSNRWTTLAPGPDAISVPSNAFWTGHRLLVLGHNGYCCYPTGDGPPFVGALYDPETGRATTIRHGALNPNSSSVWTGAAVWSFVPIDYDHSPGMGHTRLYDPTSNTTQPLKPAPFGAYYPPTPIWTGTSVLLYSPETRIEPAQPQPVGGLEYIAG